MVHTLSIAVIYPTQIEVGIKFTPAALAPGSGSPANAWQINDPLTKKTRNPTALNNGICNKMNSAYNFVNVKKNVERFCHEKWPTDFIILLWNLI